MNHGDKFQAIRKSNGKPVNNGEVFTVMSIRNEDGIKWIKAYVSGKPLPRYKCYQLFTRLFDFYVV